MWIMQRFAPMRQAHDAIWMCLLTLVALPAPAQPVTWAWGDNYWGELGDGTTADRYAPVQVNGLGGVVALAGGAFHSLVLLSDGTVRAWGQNTYRQLGDGTTTNRSTPVPVGGLHGVATIVSGGYHCLALLTDGTVAAWGLNSLGMLGDGTTVDRSTPVRVSRLGGAVVIAGGYSQSLARTVTGSTPTLLYTNPSSGFAGQTVTLVTALWSNGVSLIGEPVDVAEGTSFLGTAITDDRGIARLTYTIPAGTAAGEHTITATFPGDHTYAPSHRDLRLTVKKRPTIAYTNPAHGYPGRTIVLVASLWGYNGRLPGRTTTFREGPNELGTATTDDRGVARLTYTIPTDTVPGAHTVTAAFAGDGDFLACTRDLPLTVAAVGTPMPTMTFTNPASGAAGATVALTASVWSDGIPLPGKTLLFREGTDLLGSATTDDRGVARLPYTIPRAKSAGRYTLSAAFAGDADFLASDHDLSLTVN